MIVALALLVSFLGNGDTSIAFTAPGPGTFALMASSDGAHWVPWCSGPVAANGTASVLVKHCPNSQPMHWQGQFTPQAAPLYRVNRAHAPHLKTPPEFQ